MGPQGLAPYFFDLEFTGHASDEGHLAAKLEAFSAWWAPDGNLLYLRVLHHGSIHVGGKMDQQRAREIAKEAGEQAGKKADEAVQRVGTEVQPALDQGKAAVQDLANRASESGRQAMGRAGEFVEGAAPQAKQEASNLYDQAAQSGEYVRQYAAQQPLTAMLVAGVIGYTLGYLIHRH
jgi:ElaB/YqjD/DUF883 family membrane-anchored ribosome-binding protein